MSPSAERSDDDVEIVDSGHLVATRNPDGDTPEFWAVVENEGETERITIGLELRDGSGVLSRHERTHTVEALDRKRYRFSVPTPDGFDQYVFDVARRESQ